MKKVIFFLYLLVPLTLYTQTDTIQQSYAETVLIPFSQGRYMGLKKVSYIRTTAWLKKDGLQEFLWTRTNPVTDSVVLISADQHYIRINHKEPATANEGDFYMESAFVVEDIRKKTGILDSLGNPVTTLLFDEAYHTDMESLPFIVRIKKEWGFLKSDGTLIDPQYGLPLHGWDGPGDKVKSIDKFLDAGIAYMYYETIRVKGQELYALVMSRKGIRVYIDPATGLEVLPDMG